MNNYANRGLRSRKQIILLLYAIDPVLYFVEVCVFKSAMGFLELVCYRTLHIPKNVMACNNSYVALQSCALRNDMKCSGAGLVCMLMSVIACIGQQSGSFVNVNNDGTKKK